MSSNPSPLVVLFLSEDALVSLAIGSTTDPRKSRKLVKPDAGAHGGFRESFPAALDTEEASPGAPCETCRPISSLDSAEILYIRRYLNMTSYRAVAKTGTKHEGVITEPEVEPRRLLATLLRF